MPETQYAQVGDAAGLRDLIGEVVSEFWHRLPYELDRSRRPNTLRLTTMSVFESWSPARQQEVVVALFTLDDLTLGDDFDPMRAFATADTTDDVITDLVCEIVASVLRRDKRLRAEDDCRMALSAESREAMLEQELEL